MRLKDITNTDVLRRPKDNGRIVLDGEYKGKITMADLVEKPSIYEKDKLRVVLEIKVEVRNEDGEKIELFTSTTYNWSSRSNMVKMLEKLEALPEPGESISLSDLEGTLVKVTVENITKDKETYSNIVNMRKIATNKKTTNRSAIYTREAAVKPLKRKKKREEECEIDIDDIEDEDYETNQDYETDDDFDDLDDL